MTTKKRILFAGYAPVHFLCFRPVYERLRDRPDVELWLSGGLRGKPADGDEPTYDLEEFYEPFDVDPERLISIEDVRKEHFDVVVCSHSSDVFFPRSYGKAVQIFHGVSFKNFAVGEKVLKYDYACVAGRYHAERFQEQGILGQGDTQFFLTGFPKTDGLVSGSFDRAEFLRERGVDPSLPTVLYAPTGGKHNSLDTMGEQLVKEIGEDGRWNLILKPHDHPKKQVDWFEVLAPFENERVRVVRDLDVVPLLRAADLLLTDASSVSMEYTLVDRPMVFLESPKLIQNVVKRGGALDLETYGRKLGFLAKDHGDVVETIERALAQPSVHGELRRRAAEHLFHDGGEAADNVTAIVSFAAGLIDELPQSVQPLTTPRLSA